MWKRKPEKLKVMEEDMWYGQRVIEGEDLFSEETGDPWIWI